MQRSLYLLAVGLLQVVDANAQGVDWSRVSPSQRNWIESACRVPRDMGPSYYFPCLERNIAALNSPAARIDLTQLDAQSRNWIESACRVPRDMGPSYYYPCIERNSRALPTRSAQTAVPPATPPSAQPPATSQVLSNVQPQSATVPRSPQVVAKSEPPSPNSSGRRSVQLQKEGGTYVVPVFINNSIMLKFVVDSGASDVSLPADVVMTLIRTGTLTEADFIGTKTYVLADGSKVPSRTFRIRSLKVGDKVVENVTASMSAAEGILLLGQSFLGRFKSWSIDNANHVLILE
ncbi:MAG: retroviral-like aspartic protease family protein [Hyphomicrobiaceae bacterium]